ncbi:hypothetical protein WN51_03911 [Melipona quadrifasciata]|uniref:G-protein coupled receptors family 1 profile domain-containing protein n=1 Tax=Melipona quadrifasciata TaxID=166423 RepID=A0A0M8ZPG9_9HYME|nr:hypothetical protein WN51_03911 [Melipona quadrifasciata]
MLTGIFKGTLLCCDENSTWNNIINADKHALNETTSLLRVLYRIVIPTMVIGGIFGNVLIILVLSTPVFRGVAYLYLRGLTLANAGVLLSWIPVFIRLGYGLRNNYPSVFYHAHLELVAVNTFAIASILIMTCLIVSAPLTGMRMVYEQQENTGTLFTLRENISITRSALWNAYIWIMEVALRLCPTIILLLLNSFVVKRFLQLNAKKREFQRFQKNFNRCKKSTVEEDVERPIGEIEDYSRHGTTVRLTPEQTKLNSPASASKLNPMEEDKESEVLNASDIV